MYGTHKCRCQDCKAIKAEQHARLYGISADLSANLTRRYIKTLHQAGFSDSDIAAASGVSRGTLVRIKSNRKAVIHETTHAAILGVKHSDLPRVKIIAEHTTIDGATPRAQIQELISCGWTCMDMADRSGMDVKAFYRVLRGGNVTLKTSQQVARLYALIRYQSPPEDTQLQRKRVERAKNQALANGWDGFMAEFLEAA